MCGSSNSYVTVSSGCGSYSIPVRWVSGGCGSSGYYVPSGGGC